MPAPRTYLLSRGLDPVLGVFTGLLAYRLHETNPRSAPPEGHTLLALAGWRWGVAKERRVEREAAHAETETRAQQSESGGQAGEAEWESVRRELVGEESKGART
jgi:hypothetical protein